MTKYQFRKGMRLLDHAIEHLGPTSPCGLLIQDGMIVGNLPATSNNADITRAVLVTAMLKLMKEAA